MPADNTTKRQHVQSEEGGAEDGALGDTTCDRQCLGVDTTQGDTLCPLREVRGEPIECGTRVLL